MKVVPLLLMGVGLCGLGLVLWWPDAILETCPWLNIGSQSAEGSGWDSTGTREYTLEELAQHNGEDESKPILLALHGEVFDVTSGRQFYGKGAPYQCFAGRDSTRALTLGVLDQKDIERGGDISDFNEQQRGSLATQQTFYRTKYPLVGKLKYPTSSAAKIPATTPAAKSSDL